MLNVFGWIRRRVSQAILEGTQDALEALDAGNGTNTIPAPIGLPAALQARLTALPALPGSNGDGPEPPAPTPDQAEPAAEPGTNGRRKRS